MAETQPAPVPPSPAPPRRGEWLAVAAYVVIVIAGLRAASGIILPILLAAVASLIFLRPTRYLKAKGVPGPIAALVMVAAMATIWILLSVGISSSINQFSEAIPKLDSESNSMIGTTLGKLQSTFGGTDSFWGDLEHQLQQVLDPGALLGFVNTAVSSILGILSDLFVILLIMVFVLLEAHEFPAKLRSAFGPDANLTAVSQVTDMVFDYLFLKSLVSVMTGAAVAVMTATFGIGMPLLWGAIAFAFNFIPNIGSIIAAVPTVLFALVGFGWSTALGVAIGYLVINVVIGNILETRIMGKKFGLSSVVVFVSLLFWSWVWGPIGMLLSIPLTMVLKIVLEHTQNYRCVAVLLGPEIEPCGNRG